MHPARLMRLSIIFHVIVSRYFWILIGATLPMVKHLALSFFICPMLSAGSDGVIRDRN
jgi:hypothetical protein